MSKEFREYLADANLAALNDLVPEWKAKIEHNLRKHKMPLVFAELLGAGSYGAVFATDDPAYVIKITSDTHEALFLEEVRKAQRGASRSRQSQVRMSLLEDDDKNLNATAVMYRSGFCRVFFVGSFQELPPLAKYHVIVRENVFPDREATAYMSEYMSQLMLMKDATDPNLTEEEVEQRDEAAPVYLRSLYRQYLDDPDFQDRLQRGIENVERHAPNIAAALKYYLQNKRILRDIHYANVGVRTQPGMVFWNMPDVGIGDHVMYDPGMTRPIDVRSSRKSIRRINPKHPVLDAEQRRALDEIASRCDGWFD